MANLLIVSVHIYSLSIYRASTIGTTRYCLTGSTKCHCFQGSSWKLLSLQALNNTAFRRQGNETDIDVVSEATVSQPWQLATLQEAANFSNGQEAERYRCVAELLSGMLHPDASQRMTAKQLAMQQWLRAYGTRELGPCPATLQKVLQR